mmetsp:Transcript_19047/g.21211  ORF Transcript_19047/g.21211 Transcript_19047/m.21211 type:complete len:519 (+) Transcript_19047:48-1604(+)
MVSISFGINITSFALAVLFIVVLHVDCVVSSKACQFAQNYSAKELIENEATLNRFLGEVFTWEHNFWKAAINPLNGMTYDGHALDETTGLLAPPLHDFSAASKEAIPLMICTRVFLGDDLAKVVVAGTDPSGAEKACFSMLTLKIKTLNEFNTMFPKFQGYLPWFKHNGTKIGLLQGWTDRVPALDNGEMIWGMYALYNVLQDSENGEYKNLGAAYKKYFDYMAQTAKPLFYKGDGHVASVAQVGSTQQAESNLKDLDDPYEGEMFTFFMDLFSPWKNESERELLWIVKRPLLVSVDYQTPKGNITVQKGWWFSSHEQWKYMELPYFSVGINKRIFMNGERARTQNSCLKGLPGLKASVTDVSDGNTKRTMQLGDYLSDNGIPEIAFQPSSDKEVFTPYASFPTILANKSIGASWYLSMIKGSKMQGHYGSTCSVSGDGTKIAPLVTWDSKMTTVIAMLGGVQDVVEKYLERDGKLQRFKDVVTREWSLKFPKITGEEIPLCVPSESVPNILPIFTHC